jgi:hypothetical protein
METTSNVIVFCLYYDDRTKAYIDRHYAHLVGIWLSPIQIPETTKYMENVFYITWLADHKHLWKHKDYVGVVSWKFDQKIRVPDLSCYRGDEDFVGFYLQRDNLVAHTSQWHPQFAYLYTRLLQRMGYTLDLVLSPDVPYFVYNYWMAKPVWMARYIEFLRNIMDLMEAWPEIQEALYADAHFEIPPHLTEQRLMEIFQRPHYTHHCFVLERMAPFFFWAEGAWMRALQTS